MQAISSCPNGPVKIIHFGRFSVVLLSSWVENKEHGMLTKDRLEQLEEHLINNEDQVNIIAIHYPPILINSKWLDAIALQNRAEFLQLIEQHSHKTLILFGHVHQEVEKKGLSLLSTSTTCYQFEPDCVDIRRAYSPPAYRFVKVADTGHIETKAHYVG